MMSRKILVLGATGILGQPVTNCLVERGYQVRVLARNFEKAHHMFGNAVEIVEGSAQNKEKIHEAVVGCEAVHINLSQDSELVAMQHVIDETKHTDLDRVTYVSATTAIEENRWFEMIDIKIRTENILRRSGIGYTIFCPTWAMETLHNLIRGERAVVIIGKNPPKLHFLAAADFGRIVAMSYEDNRAFGKRLFIHGPDAFTLLEAFERFGNACHPELKKVQMKLWQAQWIAKISGRKELAEITKLIAYFDKVGELGDPAEANALFGAPSITLEEWLKMLKMPERVVTPT